MQRLATEIVWRSLRKELQSKLLVQWTLRRELAQINLLRTCADKLALTSSRREAFAGSAGKWRGEAADKLRRLAQGISR